MSFICLQIFANIHKNSISVAAPVRLEEYERQQAAYQFGKRHGQPYTVQAENARQEQYGAHLQEYGSGEGYDGAHLAVIQGGEEGGGEDIVMRKEIREGVEAETPGGRACAAGRAKD